MVTIDGYGNTTVFCDGCENLHTVEDAWPRGRTRPGLRCLHYGRTVGEVGTNPIRLKNCTAYTKRRQATLSDPPKRTRFQMAVAKAAMLTAIVLAVSVPAKTPKYDTLSVRHKFYTSAFDTTLRYPVVVRWWATQAMLTCSGRSAREDDFDPDPLLAKWTDLDKDYKGSGYDRGHNMPAFDNGCDSSGNHECFLYSNVTPQTARLNRGDWKELENYTRSKVMEYDSVKVWCGSVGAVKKIGRVSVPRQCWKVIWVKKTRTYEAYLFDNDGPSTTLQAHRTTTAILYKLTGIKTK